MGRQNLRGVRERRQALEGALLVPRERIGQDRAKEIGPARRADEEAAAGEDADGILGRRITAATPAGSTATLARSTARTREVRHRPRQVLRRVARRRPRRQSKVADLDRAALIDREV